MSQHTENSTCFECDRGVCREVTEPYEVQLPDGDNFTIPALTILRCDACGELSIPAASAKAIDAAILEYSDTVSVEFLKDFLTSFNLDQTEAAEALGLGAKTFHRWVRATQRVSRSMGYFLRAIVEFPEAFEWIQQRRWRGVRVACSVSVVPSPTVEISVATVRQKFPAIFQRIESTSGRNVGRFVDPSFNAARVFGSVGRR